MAHDRPGDGLFAGHSTMSYVTGRTFDYDFEHLPIKGQEPDYVS